MILHSSRSGLPSSPAEEFALTVAFARAGANGLGWNATVGQRQVALHIPPTHWGYNARGHSQRYLAVEFSQSRQADIIADSQIEAFVWWFQSVAREQWPSLPPFFICHSELEAGVEDGKTDPFPVGAEADIFRQRILDSIPI